MELQEGAINGLRSHFERLGLPVPERVPPPYAPERTRQIEAVCDIRPGVLTVHLGDMTPDVVTRLRDLGVRVGGSATSVREARHLEAFGADFIIAQGTEAGGHRGMFLSDDLTTQVGTFALLPQIVQFVGQHQCRHQQHARLAGGPGRGLDILDPLVEVGGQRAQMFFLAVRAAEDVCVTVDLK